LRLHRRRRGRPKGWSPRREGRLRHFAALETARNKKAANPLKTNNLAKSLISRPQQSQGLNAPLAKRFVSFGERFPCAFAVLRRADVRNEMTRGLGTALAVVSPVRPELPSGDRSAARRRRRFGSWRRKKLRKGGVKMLKSLVCATSCARAPIADLGTP